MILLIDWGNTFLKYILIDDSANIEPQLKMNRIRKTDSPNALVLAISANENGNKKEISNAYISSVRKPSDNKRLTSTLESLNIDSIFVQTEKKFDNICCAYDKFENLGVDRWLTVIASYHEEKTIGIIDIGSAITLDVVSKNGQHLGGHIVPGVRLSLDSLKTADRITISEKTEEKTNRLLGKSTSECVRLGVDQMIKGYLEKTINEVTKQYQVEHWIFTGGGGEFWSQNLSDNRNNHCSYDGRLVFKGLIKYLGY